MAPSWFDPPIQLPAHIERQNGLNSGRPLAPGAEGSADIQSVAPDRPGGRARPSVVMASRTAFRLRCESRFFPSLEAASNQHVVAHSPALNCRLWKSDALFPVPAAAELYTIRGTVSLGVERHEDAAWNTNRVFVVRQRVDGGRSTRGSFALGPGTGGPGDDGHPGGRAPCLASRRGQPAPRTRPAALEAARNSGGRGRGAHRAEGALRAVDCRRGGQAGSPGADRGRSRRAHLQNRCRRDLADGRPKPRLPPWPWEK